VIPRTVRIVVLCAVLSVLAGQAFGQETVRLEYKFKQGELLRYKMVMSATINMQMSMPDGSSGQMPSIPMQMVGVMRQRTRKVLPNGDAEVAYAFESMKVTVGDMTQQSPTEKIPVITMVISKNGVPKSIQGLEKLGGQSGYTQFISPETLGQYGALPEGDLKVGDTWSQDVPFPIGGRLQMSGKLLSTDTKLGSYTVATFEQNTGGDINMNIPVPMPSNGAPSTGGNVGANGEFLGDTTVYFSLEEGKMIRTSGRATLQMKVDIAGAAGTGNANAPGGIDMNMDMNFEMFLLPGQAK